jgi:glycerophosphoryl diester phosphodiesterase
MRAAIRMKTPILVAHRGYPAQYPENTLVGYRAALAAGARWMETDIQFSRDGVAVLYHDHSLERTSGRAGLICDFDAADLFTMPASRYGTFSQRFATQRIEPLSALVELLHAWPHAELMVELKAETLDQFGVEATVDGVLETLAPVIDRCVMISFRIDSLIATWQKSKMRVGWVLPAWNAQIEQQARHSPCEFLICDRQLLPDAPAPLWNGPWQWMVYCIDEVEQALQQPARGIEYVETNRIVDLLADPRLRHLHGAESS